MLDNTRRIVVMGGAGFIGSHLVDRLLADTRAEIIVIDNLTGGSWTNLAARLHERRLLTITGDVRDRDVVEAGVRGADIVYHLAAAPNDPANDGDPDDIFETNVVGTFNVLRAAAWHAVRRLVFVSSCAVYGNPVTVPVDESHPLLTSSAFGASKVSGESFCRAFSRAFGLSTVILRLTDVYGPRDRASLIPGWIDSVIAGADLLIQGDDQIADLVWVDQVVEALVRAPSLEGPLPPINVGSGTGTRLVDVARRIVRLYGGRYLVTKRALGDGEARRFVADVDRMRQLLQIEPPLDPLMHLPRLALGLVHAGATLG